jgi:hypothetical protein
MSVGEIPTHLVSGTHSIAVAYREKRRWNSGDSGLKLRVFNDVGIRLMTDFEVGQYLYLLFFFSRNLHVLL